MGNHDCACLRAGYVCCCYCGCGCCLPEGPTDRIDDLDEPDPDALQIRYRDWNAQFEKALPQLKGTLGRYPSFLAGYYLGWKDRRLLPIPSELAGLVAQAEGQAAEQADEQAQADGVH